MSITEDYLRFNVGSIDELIKQNLEPKFPDVNFRGSSANILSETVSSVFSLLIYQLNRTASNSSFAKTESLTSLIEQTKILGYNPVGYQSSNMFFDILPDGNFDTISYTIPRYTNVRTGSGNFTTSEDLEFTYSGSPDTAVLEDVILRGGTWVEYPTILGDGSTNQRYTISNTNNDLIDHNNIHVYIKDVDNNGEWEQWEQVDSLFLSNGFDKNFESRFNTRNSYDLTFGDGVNGCFIPDNAEIAIYYISIDTLDSTISSGTISENMVRLSTDRLNSILMDIIDTDKTNVIGNTSGLFLAQNTSNNTAFSEPETLEEIRRNAPVAFKTQNRLVTAEDFRSYVLNNFSEFISDVAILSNDEYVNEYLQYYYNQGLNNPNLESRALYNQINYSDACNFNNIYIFLIPRNGNFATDIQKQLIINGTQDIKTITSNIVPSDPIYINFALATPLNSITREDTENSTLEIVKSINNNRSDDDIQAEVYSTIVTYFDERSQTFSNSIDIFELNASLLNISGVQEINTVNESVSNQGLQMYQFNPQFPESVYTTPPSNLFSGIFVPRLFDDNLLNRISIINS